MQLYGDTKERGVLASGEPVRIAVRSDAFGIRGKRVLHLIACQFRTWAASFPVGSGSICTLKRHLRSWLDRGLEFAEGLGGRAEGVGDGLVPVHVRAAGAQFLRPLFAQGFG